MNCFGLAAVWPFACPLGDGGEERRSDGHSAQAPEERSSSGFAFSCSELLVFQVREHGRATEGIRLRQISEHIENRAVGAQVGGDVVSATHWSFGFGSRA